MGQNKRDKYQYMKQIHLKISFCALSLASAVICAPSISAAQPSAQAMVKKESKSEAVPGDQVLVDCKHATEALRSGDFNSAKEALDRALLTMNATTVGAKDAKKARSAFSKESVKMFKGEPYERSMANYYRGILYWKDGEVDNARACFITAQMQDASNDISKHSEFVMMDYLVGLANAITGADPNGPLTLARKNYMARNDNACALPDYNPKANILVFLESGKGPVKFADGENKEHLAYHDGSSTVESITASLGDKTVCTTPWDNITDQAKARGGRQMDQILTNKAAFKETTDKVGDVALVAGVATAAAGGDGRVAGGLAALGLLSKITSSAVKPEADTRCWDTLPQILAFAAFEAPPGEHQVSIKFLDKSKGVIAEKQITVRLEADKKSAVLFVKD